jgi:hypothetical protein
MTSSTSPKLRHLVLFSFKPEATSGDIARVERSFAALPARIPQILDFEWGTDVSVEGRAQGFTHAFLVTFADEAGRDAYLPHPAHQEFVSLVQAQRQNVLVLDYWSRG